jgi:hypothetical protein
MIEIHGGRLRLESALGNGTSAELVFPAERISAARGDGLDAEPASQDQRSRHAPRAKL